MRHELASTKNVRRFQAAMRELRERPLGVEGMGLLWGRPGEGKSTLVAHSANQTDGIYLRANAGMTMTSMLQAIVHELGGVPAGRRAPMMNYCFEKLRGSRRPIYVDEADYLFRQTEMLDALRDIYDETKSPVILIGMEDIARTIQQNGRFARRITAWIEFKGIDIEDARTVADTICEVSLADDLLEHLHQESAANIGRMVVGLSRIERFAKASGLATVSLAVWGERELFYDQPNFNKGRKR
jgi:DNA transposition AAA+ family ATPase